MSNVTVYIKQFVVCLNLNSSHASSSQADCDASAGLAAASEQLPVVGDTKAQTDAQMLLDAWVLPLALLQEDINCLAGRLAQCHCTDRQHCTYKLIYDLFADVMQDFQLSTLLQQLQVATSIYVATSHYHCGVDAMSMSMMS
jgi:hypothetical protein